MKILLDECLNWRLKKELGAHEVYSVQDMNWSGIENGELMNLAMHAGFEVFVTIDKNLKYQQNVFPAVTVNEPDLCTMTVIMQNGISSRRFDDSYLP